MKLHIVTLVVALNVMMCLGQPVTDAPLTQQPATTAPDADESSPLRWMGIAVNVFIVVVLLMVSCWMVRPSKSKPGGGLKMVLPPHTLKELRRLFTNDLRAVIPTEAEHIILDLRKDSKTSCLRDLPKSMMCWRRSQLSASMLFYAADLAMTIFNLCTSGSLSSDVDEDAILSIDTVLRKHFREQTFAMIPFSQAILSLSFFSFAAYRWQDLNQSRFLTVCGFVLTFLMPFAFFMVPWMEIDNPQLMVQDTCSLLANSGLPIITKVASVPLKDTDICSKQAHEIGDAFVSELLLDRENGKVVLALMGSVLRLLVYVPTLISSFIVMKSLAPGVLGILMGLQGGLSVSKATLPGARLTTWLLVLLQAAALPVTMFLCAIILIVVGTLPTMFTALFMTTSASLYIVFHEKLLKANRVDDATALVRKLGRMALILKLLSVICLIFGVLKAPHLVALKAEGIKSIKNALLPQSVIRMGISFMAGFFSSKVVFADIVLHIILSTYVSCIDDPKTDRNNIMKDLLYLSVALNGFEAKIDVEALKSDDDSNKYISELGQLTIAAPIDGLLQHESHDTGDFQSPNLSSPDLYTYAELLPTTSLLHGETTGSVVS